MPVSTKKVGMVQLTFSTDATEQNHTKNKFINEKTSVEKNKLPLEPTYFEYGLFAIIAYDKNPSIAIPINNFETWVSFHSKIF